MLTLRLQRVGRKHDPSYRIVATNSRTGPKSNKHVELLGQYDSIRKTKNIDADAVKRHLANGAQVSTTLRNVLIGEGIIEGKKTNALSKKSPIVDQEAIDAAKAAEEEAAAKAQADKEAAEAAEAAPAEESATEETPAEEEAETTEVTEEVTEEPAEAEVAEEPATEEAPAEEEKKEEA